jgi:hypothetical protein
MASSIDLRFGGAATSQACGSWGTKNPTLPDPHQSEVAPQPIFVTLWRQTLMKLDKKETAKNKKPKK